MADIKLFFGRTEKVKPKEFYFDGLVMERILSYIPKPKNNTFKVGSFYCKMMRVDRDTLKVSLLQLIWQLIGLINLLL